MGKYDFLIVALIFVVVVFGGALIMAQFDISENICISHGATHKVSNATGNHVEQICIWPNGTEILIKDLRIKEDEE